MNLVDSSAWLAYLAGEKNAEFFAPAIEEIELLVVPTICLYEVFKVVFREEGEDDAFLAIAATHQCTVIDLTPDLATEAWPQNASVASMLKLVRGFTSSTQALVATATPRLPLAISLAAATVLR